MCRPGQKSPTIDPARMLEEQLAQASPDLLRELLGSFINTLLSAEADAVCGVEYGTVSAERSNRRNGYRHCDFDTALGPWTGRSPSCGRALISPSGSWSAASGPSER